LGNPPYLGFSIQEKSHKEDLLFVFNKKSKLDYVSCWFYKSAKYINSYNKIKAAFVTTNSISQGEQVALIWPLILSEKVEIFFAHTSYKWKNNAKGSAGVTVAIIGLRKKSKQTKYIYSENNIKECTNISPYLSSGKSAYVAKRKSSLSDIPFMYLGNMAKDGGNLFLTDEERNSIIINNPNAENFIKKALGSFEFINNRNQWCIWVSDTQYNRVKSIIDFKNRFDAVRNMRLNSKKKATREYSTKPYRFIEIRHQNSNSIIVPRVSSERRLYIPIGFLTNDYIVKDSAYAVYNAEPWHFGLLSSKMHMTWVRTVAGRLKTDYRYSSTLVYNTFPFPSSSTQRKNEIIQSVFRILEEREKHPEKTIAQLYDPDKMPEGLREAHRINDLAIERCYRSKPFESDEERLEYLFKLYEKMIQEEKNKSALSEKQKKARKRK